MTMHYDPSLDAAQDAIVTGPGAQRQDRSGQRSADAAAIRNADAVMKDAFDIADGLFREAAEDFARLRQQLREAGAPRGRGRAAAKPAAAQDGLKEAVRLARELRAATQIMLEERNRVDKLRKDIAGGVGAGGALDLDAARDEIGRRLACLRRAAGG